jgi:NAD(P)H-binding
MLTSDSMRIAVLGAGGGLGRNVVDAARAAKHDVVALVRDPKRAELPDDVTTVVGDATHVDVVVRAMAGADATMFCVNPPFATWLTTFPPLLACAIAAARKTNTRLVFPANVWIYGPGRAGELVAETRAPAPTSQRGKLRAEMEQQIRAAGIRYAIVRLPESYGPNVVSVPAPVFQAALADRRALWPGSLDVAVELVYPRCRARHGGSRGRRGLRRRHLPSSGRSDDAAPVRRARVPGGGSQAARVRRAALGAVHRRRVRCERTRRGRHRTSVDASDPARWRKVQRTLRRDPPDSARRRDRDDARVASRASRVSSPALMANFAHEVDPGLEEFLVKLTVQGPDSGQLRDAEAGLESLRLGIAALRVRRIPGWPIDPTHSSPPGR